MRHFWIWVVYLWVGAIATAESTDNRSMTAPVPDWVIEQAIPGENVDRTSANRDGIAYLLLDEQTRWNNGGVDFYYRFSYKVTDRTGLEEAARITPNFDPETTTLAFDRLKVIRDGAEFDRLESTKVELLKREDSLQNGILDGHLTAMLQLSDIRVGDTIDYAYHGRRETPLWPDEFFFRTSVEWSVPIALQSARVIVPSGSNLVATRVETNIDITNTSSNGWDEYRFVSEDPAPIPGESNLPNDAELFGYVAFSSMDAWADVVDWGLGLYDVKGELPKGFAQRVDKIARDNSSMDDRLVAALFLVQSEVRYLGIESGLGSHKPRSPAETVRLGYGDCKDKSLLLSVALKRLGIDAHPALASLSDGFTLERGAVAITAFDHAIVEARLNGKTYWIDPTRSHQAGSLEHLSELDYGYVLPLRKDVSSLVMIERSVPAAPNVDMVETYTIPETGDHGLLLDVSTTYHGIKADQMRYRLANDGPDKTSRKYLDYYADRYPELEARSALSVSDDLKMNTIVLTEAYRLSRAAFEAQELNTSLFVEASSITDELVTSIETNRTSDLWLPYGINRIHTIRIHTPGRQFSAKYDIEWNDVGIDYTRRISSTAEWLEIVFSLSVNERSVPVSEARQAVNRAEDIDEQNKLTINITKAGKTFSRRLGLDSSLPPTTESELSELLILIAAKKNLEALERINTLSEKYTEADAVRGFVSFLKGGILVDLDRSAAAQVAFDDAFSLLEPDTPQAYLIYASMLERDEKYVEAANIVTRLFDNLPESFESIRMEWVGRLGRQLKDAGHFEENDTMAIAAALAHYKNKDKVSASDRWVYAAAIEPLVKKGDIDLARELLAEVKDPEMAVILAMNQSLEPLWPDLDALHGSQLEKGIEAFVADSRQEAEDFPYDFLTQARYLNALRQAGSLESAATYGATVMENWAKIEAVGEDAFWFVNEYAMVLADAGRIDEALGVFDKLLALGIEQHPQLISFAINKTHVLLDAGRFDAVLGEIEKIESLDEDVSSDYGKMFVYDAKACSLSELGRSQAALSVWTEQVSKISDVNRSARMHTMICLGMNEEAADLMIRWLQNPGERGAAIYSYVQATKPVGKHDFGAKRRERARTIRLRPEVLAEFNKVGRKIRVNGGEAYWNAR